MRERELLKPHYLHVNKARHLLVSWPAILRNATGTVISDPSIYILEKPNKDIGITTSKINAVPSIPVITRTRPVVTPHLC